MGIGQTCESRASALLLGVLLSGSAFAEPAPVLFDWFEYTGRDAAFEQPLPEGHYRNPILAGFYPDPSIVRVEDRYYLVNSSFGYFPGIPIFESRDLVHWTQLGHVIDRPEQLDVDGLRISRGIFAPAIEHHDGTFYLVTTAVDAGGNFVVTATDPAGSWSNPHWLPEVDGIDPSLFFDDDGSAWLLNNGAPEGTPRYDGHRAIWLQRFDPAALRTVGPRRVLVDGGADPATNPIWIEGPHLYKRDGWYLLTSAEGGTGPQHSQVVLRSRDIQGPYEAYAHNPILTQRDLPADRPAPITNAGHADLVEAPDGRWWAVFLASRPYVGNHYNTGRETFLLPVEWRDGWPTILDRGQAIPYAAPAPAAMPAAAAQAPLAGNFTWRDDFDGPALDPLWTFVRVPKTPWADLAAQPGQLAVRPLRDGLDSLHSPAFLARRQQHLAFEASTALAVPTEVGVSAGLALFQGERHWLFLGARRAGQGAQLFLERHDGDARDIVATAAIAADAPLTLKVVADGAHYAFAYKDGDDWRWLARDVDGHLLSTESAGGFVGATLGPHARLDPEPAE
ncbi:glycoside hydrolase family 43 protein [Luteimonas sp. FCS-9]|uniref:glycoside hydrolase family 43 protein n=1 Tax=Luteimonas sp. FCS-9 TaxID=1547516 RepID=UPI0012E0BF9E|nr:glycoside hydrolase family 43 protein [Luteimonas sp. FCS-9]